VLLALAAAWYGRNAWREGEKADADAQAQYEVAKAACFKSAPNADVYEECIQTYVDDHSPEREQRTD
jgi:hypothetical protein